MRRRPKGSGTISQEGNGWSLRIRLAGEEIYESGFRSSGEAESRAAILRAERIQRRLGVAADPRLSPTLGQLSTDWLDRREATHASGKNDRYRWVKHLAPRFGRLRPSEVGTAEVRAFVETIRREMAPGTVRLIVALLSSLYEDLRERVRPSATPPATYPRAWSG